MKLNDLMNMWGRSASSGLSSLESSLHNKLNQVGQDLQKQIPQYNPQSENPVVKSVLTATAPGVQSFLSGGFKGYANQMATAKAPSPETLVMGFMNPEGDIAEELAPLADEAKTFFHVTDSDSAKLIREQGFKPQIGERSLGVANAKGTWLYESKDPTEAFARNFERIGKTPETIETQVSGKIFDGTNDDRSIRGLVEDKKLISSLKKQGYVGIKGDELGTSATFIFEPSAIKVIK